LKDFKTEKHTCDDTDLHKAFGGLPNKTKYETFVFWGFLEDWGLSETESSE